MSLRASLRWLEDDLWSAAFVAILVGAIILLATAGGTY